MTWRIMWGHSGGVYPTARKASEYASNVWGVVEGDTGAEAFEAFAQEWRSDFPDDPPSDHYIDEARREIHVIWPTTPTIRAIEPEWTGYYATGPNVRDAAGGLVCVVTDPYEDVERSDERKHRLAEIIAGLLNQDAVRRHLRRDGR